VSRALQTVLNHGPDKAKNKVNAYAVLEASAGLKSAKDLKPAQYQAVIDACAAFVAKPASKQPAPAQSAVDDFGQAGGESEDAYGDPPEHTGSGQDAEGGGGGEDA
jgi:hypothetical protein